MLRKTTQWAIDRLVERSLPSVGAYIASAMQRMLILGHVDHHNQLEEQALRYEADGKPQLAAILREQASKLSLEDPLAGAPAISANLNEAGSQDGFPLAIEEEPTVVRNAGSDHKAPENGSERTQKGDSSDA